jgi:AraC-like DNA-binding protein
VSLVQEDENRRLLRARDAMDRGYREPLDVPALARVAYMSEAHFTRRFKAVFGETPGRYLQRRRIERAMSLLRRTELTVAEVCTDVGFTSLATFSRRFKEIVGETPTAFRAHGAGATGLVPTCFEKAWTRPR